MAMNNHDRMEHGHVVDEHADNEEYEIEPYDELEDVRQRHDDWEY